MSHVVNLIVSLIAIVLGAGIGVAGSLGGISVPMGNASIPVFAICTVASYIINLLGYFAAYAMHTERFYDITGSFTYLTVIAIGLGIAISQNVTSSRKYILAGIVCFWTLRLGLFLFRRALRFGDSRFEAALNNWSEFLKFWMLQALWVILTVGAALAAITGAHDPGTFSTIASFVLSVIGIVLWVFGMLTEMVADYQKAVFRENRANAGQFIQSGLWAISRHPNYLGEIVLWVGVAFLAGPGLFEYQFITLISPIFVFVLIRFASGVPILEKSADERWGGQASYESYKRRVPVLFPNPLNWCTRSSPGYVERN